MDAMSDEKPEWPDGDSMSLEWPTPGGMPGTDDSDDVRRATICAGPWDMDDVMWETVFHAVRSAREACEEEA